MTLNSRQLYPIGYLPIATESELGVIKVGDGLSIDPDGLLSSDALLLRETFTLTTPPIAPSANLQTSLEIAQDFFIIQVATNVAARVRMYSNPIYQNNDANRGLVSNNPATNYPMGDHGVLLETRSNSSFQSINRSPISMISTVPPSNTVPITITNLSDSEIPVILDLLIFRFA